MIQIYNPAFRQITKSEALKSISFNEQWRPYGFTQSRYSEKTSTVYVGKTANDFKFI